MNIDGLNFDIQEFHQDDILLIKICLDHEFVSAEDLQKVLANLSERQLIFQLQDKGYISSEQVYELIRIHNGKTICLECGTLLKKRALTCTKCGNKLTERDVVTRKNRKYGKYRTIHKVGEGSVGVVYKAMQSDLERIVALKVMQSNLDENAFKRFKQEAQAIATLNHPSIVSLYDIGQQKNEYFLAMEFVEGDPLTKYIKRRKFTLEESLKVIVQIIRGLQHAHEKEIIHRDIKPDNIIITTSKKPKITDFGLARRLDEKLRITHKDIIMGTPMYMSPEQANGDSNCKYSTDIYSAGVVFYEMLSGELPFSNSATLVLLNRIVHDPPPLLRSVEPSIPPKLEKICMKALQKDPKSRYKNIKDFGDALEAFFEDNYIKKEIPIVEDIATDELEIKEPKKMTLRVPLGEERLRWYDVVIWVLIGFTIVYIYKEFS